MDRCWSRVAVAVAVGSFHAAAVKPVFDPGFRSPQRISENAFAAAEIIGTFETWDKIPAPDLQLKTVTVDLAALRQVEFDDSVQDELAEVTAPASAPHLARVQSVDPATFARRDKLPPGVALTILLRIEALSQ
jgi:hypothetical protein